MAQGALPYQYAEEKSGCATTSLGGLPLYLDLAHAVQLRESIKRHVQVRAGGQGWSDEHIILICMLLNLAGGDCVNDLERLEADDGFTQIYNRVETHGLKRCERREARRRWRCQRTRTLPSPSAVLRYLEEFHNAAQEAQRVEGKAFIPAPNSHLQGLCAVNTDLIRFMQHQRAHSIATLDQDATLVKTSKNAALYCYKGFKAYQPLNTWWAEQQVVVHSEFRDGNVPAGYEQLRVLKEALAALPKGVKKVYLRSDSAGYQHDLLRYCAKGDDKRFGVIEFAVSADVTPAFRKAVLEVPENEWHRLYRPTDQGDRIETAQQWAEVPFVPNWAAHSKHEPTYRFIAIREPMQEQGELPHIERQQQTLPFPTVKTSNGRTYKLFGVVTNRALPGDELIWWLRQRCGYSEQAHDVMKDDLAGGRLPSDKFGANAAWWMLMILAHNLHALMKALVLGESWLHRRMKAVRYHLINLAGRVYTHARQLFLRLKADHPSYALLVAARARIAAMKGGP